MRSMRAATSYAVAALALVVHGACAHAAYSLIVTDRAYHFDRTRGYNEHNFGLGLEREFSSSLAGEFGFYRNSYYRETAYAWAIYTPWRAGDWSVGTDFGLVTGYGHPVAPWLTGLVTRDWSRFGVSVLFARDGVALQLKWKLEKKGPGSN